MNYLILQSSKNLDKSITIEKDKNIEWKLTLTISKNSEIREYKVKLFLKL